MEFVDSDSPPGEDAVQVNAIDAPVVREPKREWGVAVEGCHCAVPGGRRVVGRLPDGPSYHGRLEAGPTSRQQLLDRPRERFRLRGGAEPRRHLALAADEEL